MRGLLGLPDPDDRLLLARLDRADDAAGHWRELRAAGEALTAADRDVQWTPGGPGPDGTGRMPYPQYSEALWRVVGALSAVGAVTPAYRWTDRPMPARQADGRLTAADAVRAATAIARGERFRDGTIAAAANSGMLDAVVAALLAWYDEPARGAPGSPSPGPGPTAAR
ncbi:DUF6508 domain-containing protein [Streptomyces sp. NPDC050610]|uniref:DUF6508 domain-containing protein n=1 Tax=Streptomyces sp. NPDC050610 TaxID=3157097 RepID=UPI003442BB51